MSVLEMFLNKADRLVFHMMDGSIVDIHMDYVKDINENDGFYGFHMNTGKMIGLPDKNISWMEMEPKKIQGDE